MIVLFIYVRNALQNIKKKKKKKEKKEDQNISNLSIQCLSSKFIY